jgi:hypothetical protein
MMWKSKQFYCKVKIMSQAFNIKSVTRGMAGLVPILFMATIFLSASLLFFVQPLFTKIVLPAIGGAPAVWTTAMLFFQAVLIAGYLYAHLSTKYLSVTAQLVLHLMLWAVALLFLPLSIQTGWRFDPDSPVAYQTLILFALGVGMPFVVLSANAPLIQSWYAKSDGPSADDPYFLYGASNLGSLSALLAFPLVAEPLFGAGQIGWGWTAGFVALGGFLALSGLSARNGRTVPTAQSDSDKPTVKDYCRWIVLAFIPSSLMLALTSKISTDIGSFPLVWVLPLALYLLTFVLSFSNRPWIRGRTLDTAFLLSVAIFAMTLTGMKLFHVTIPMTIVLLLAFFFVAMKAHKALYYARPGHNSLTIFYVTMSVGGALGGLFNAILAPIIFDNLHEARITIVMAAALVFVGGSKPTMSSTIKAVIAVVCIIAAPLLYDWIAIDTLAMITGLSLSLSLLLLVAVYVGRQDRIIIFAALIAVLSIGLLTTSGSAVFRDRSFFGIHIVKDNETTRLYINGTTIHGAQNLDELTDGAAPEPLYYYHPDGPMAQVLTSAKGQAATDIGIVGLGVGSLSCYRRPGQNWQFYEIDAMVDRVARDPSLFTFMSTCAPDAPTHIGDARIVLAQQVDAQYDVLVLDAYSSDSVPIHLTTNEALMLYQDRVKLGGIVLFHISNRYYDISRPLGRSADDLGLTALIQRYQGDPSDAGNSSSDVVIMSDSPDSLTEFTADPRWTPLHSDGDRIWTDDYANLLSILK